MMEGRGLLYFVSLVETFRSRNASVVFVPEQALVRAFSGFEDQTSAPFLLKKTCRRRLT
jgi:hypothetical protein